MPNSTGGGMIGWLEANPTLSLAGGIVIVLIIAGQLIKPKTPATSTPNADLSGLKNGLVYVPTQTTFTTINKQQQGVFASNDPNLTSITSGPIGNPTTTTVNKPVTINQDNDKKPPVVPPVVKPPTPPTHRNPPPPPPKPPAKQEGLVWDRRYTIRGGETLSLIAARLTTQLRAQGMPGSQSVTWHDLYAHNSSVINSTSAAHHNPIPGGPWNDIFPGETITVPEWRR